MAEIPRDPRQLARDILSGKISVEDLAREQQRRKAAAGGGAGAQPMARGPVQAPPQNRVPLPNLTAQPAQRPVVRPVPARPPVAQPRPMQGGGGAGVRVPPPQQRGRGPVISRPAAAAMPVPQPQALQAEPMAAKAYAAPKAIEDAERPRVSGRRLDVRTLARDRTRLRESILMAEVLGKPLALRDEF